MVFPGGGVEKPVEAFCRIRPLVTRKLFSAVEAQDDILVGVYLGPEDALVNHPHYQGRRYVSVLVTEAQVLCDGE